MGRKTHPAQCRPLKRRPHLGSRRRTGKRARRVQLPFRHPNQGRCRSHLLHLEAPKSPAHRSRPRPPLRKTHSEWRLAFRMTRLSALPPNQKPTACSLQSAQRNPRDSPERIDASTRVKRTTTDNKKAPRRTLISKATTITKRDGGADGARTRNLRRDRAAL